jgi:hypothetical protein
MAHIDPPCAEIVYSVLLLVCCSHAAKICMQGLVRDVNGVMEGVRQRYPALDPEVCFVDVVCVHAHVCASPQD